MVNQHYSFELDTEQRLQFIDVTDTVGDLIRSSNLKKGSVIVYSQHTSCCVIIQEESEDTTYWGEQYVLQDMLNALEKIVPPCKYEGQYLHPGPVHISNAVVLRDELPAWGLNTDGHIISCILGRSEIIPILNGEMMLGEFGRIYFGDLDRTRPRKRTIRVHLFGE